MKKTEDPNYFDQFSPDNLMAEWDKQVAELEIQEKKAVGSTPQTKAAEQDKKNKKNEYGSNNKIFTKEATDKARESLRKKLSRSQLDSGVDLELVTSEYGSKNKIFTKDMAEKARGILKKKLSGTQLNRGLDPEIMLAGMQLGVCHLEAGTKTFAAYSRKMIQDVGETIRPYLKAFYNSARHYPGFDNEGMNTAAEIDDIIENRAKKDQEYKTWIKRETKKFLKINEEEGGYPVMGKTQQQANMIEFWQENCPKMYKELKQMGILKETAWVLICKSLEEAEKLNQAGMPWPSAKRQAERDWLILDPEEQGEND